MDNPLTNIFDNTWEPTLSLGDVLKLPFIILLVCTLLYAFMLVLRVKILVDTVDSEGNGKMKALVYINLLICILATILGTVIILLG